MISKVLKTCSAHGTVKVDWNCLVTLNSIYPVSQTVELLGFWANGLVDPTLWEFRFAPFPARFASQLDPLLDLQSAELGSTPVCLALLLVASLDKRYPLYLQISDTCIWTTFM